MLIHPLNFEVVAFTLPWTFILVNLVPKLYTCAKSQLPFVWLFNTNVYSIRVIRIGEKKNSKLIHKEMEKHS